MTALITACNSALAKIAKEPITSLEEGSIEAQYCALFALEVLSEMADWMIWPDLIKRVVLAEVVNDRPAEWLYAYALPADYGEAILIRGQQEALLSAPELATPYTMPVQDRQRLAFLIEGKKLYSNTPEATLSYSTSTLDAAELSPMMRRAFIDELAFRLSVPVAKMASQRRAELQQEAFASKYEAMADAQNKSPQIAPTYVSLAEYARMGIME
jgi:hypothetical protein